MHRHLSVVIDEHLDEATHMGSFEMPRKTHREAKRRGHLLLSASAVENGNGVAQVADSYVINIDSALVQ